MSHANRVTLYSVMNGLAFLSVVRLERITTFGLDFVMDIHPWSSGGEGTLSRWVTELTRNIFGMEDGVWRMGWWIGYHGCGAGYGSFCLLPGRRHDLISTSASNNLPAQTPTGKRLPT